MYVVCRLRMTHDAYSIRENIIYFLFIDTVSINQIMIGAERDIEGTSIETSWLCITQVHKIIWIDGSLRMGYQGKQW